MNFQLIENPRFESENICSQLDRLNQALQSLTLDQTSDASFYMTTMSMDSFKTFSRISEEPEDLKLYKGMEDFLVDLDRNIMMKEDFRSNELRESGKKSKISLKLTHEEIDSLIQSLEELHGSSSLSFNTEGISLFITLSDFEVVLNEKSNISKLIMQSSFEALDQIDLDSLLKQTSFNDVIEATEQYKNLNNKKKKPEDNPIINKLEWQAYELSALKSQLQSKLIKINNSLNELNSLRSSVKSKETHLKTQQSHFIKDVETLKQHKKILEILQRENKNFVSISETAQVSLPEQSEQSIQSIQREIDRLEALDPRKSEIQTQIDRLKTKQSNLRSLKVIKDSTERSLLVSSRIKSSSNLQCFKIRTAANKENIPNSQSCHQSSLEAFQNYIKLQESRIIEKEQELSQRESALTKIWISKENDSSLTQNFLAEQRGLKILKKNLEKQQKNLENEVFCYEKKRKDLENSEKSLRFTLAQIGKFVQEMESLRIRLQFFFETLNRISFNYPESN